MSIHLLAFVLVGGMTVGDSGVKAPVEQGAQASVEQGAKAPADQAADASADQAAKDPAEQPPQPATVDSPLDKAARNYRIQTYETFHKDRAEYDRRLAEGTHVQQAWTEAGRSDAEQTKLIDWLGQATACSRTDSIAELPPAPKFTPMPQKKEPEKKLVKATTADSVQHAAATVDDLLHVKPAGSTAAAAPNAEPNSSATKTAPDTAPNTTPTTAATPSEQPASGSAASDSADETAPTNPEASAAPVVSQSKPSTISSLPRAFGDEIGRTLHSLSGNSAPNTPSQGD